ncbi:MAG: DUF1330 domain-containing protein [Pseudomonas sp.]|uniref:DUF1330 domain-containing protein n=1 Tax=Denitrificimonas caeni TaxID=521720 RepID=UPI0019623F24|nr:DUF1330 domain-containing protein [Denitrificimonas caeni]MCK9533517.1 DUF1330 domain-containing protein [Pseudomonas sp.]
MTHAYAIGHITIKDEKKWLEYQTNVPATLEPWGGELVFRGKLSSVFSGDHQHTQTVVIKFPNMKALNDWHSSAQYQSLVPLRQLAAHVDLLSYEA